MVLCEFYVVAQDTFLAHVENSPSPESKPDERVLRENLFLEGLEENHDFDDL